MKISIIRPPVLMPAFNMADLVVPPIGPAYVAAALRQKNHDVSIVDAVGLGIEQYTKYERDTLLHGLSPDQIVSRISHDVGCIGISIQFSYEWPVCRDLIVKIREKFPDVFIIAGGEHVTSVPEFTLETSPIDAVILGEGEDTVCKLVDTFAEKGKNDLGSVFGICYRDKDGKIVRTAPAPRIKDVDKIPYPAWELLPMEEYLSRGYSFGVDRGRSVPVLASRGCPYQCTFCSNPQMWTVRWKPRDPHELLDEIAVWQDKYNATNFDFYDLTMIVRRQWILDFCKAIEERKMKFTWQLPSGTRSEAIDEEVAQLLYRTGCRNVSYSPESGSVETLDKIKKRVSLPNLMQSMRGAVRKGLNVKCNFIIGFPHEKWKHVLATISACIKSAIVGIHDISIWVFVPYPGSELFTQLRSGGQIGKMDDDYFYRLAAYADITKTFSYAPALSKTALLYSRTAGTFIFYGLSWLIRPWRPFQTLFHALSGKLESRSELALRGLIKRMKKMVFPSSK